MVFRHLMDWLHHRFPFPRLLRKLAQDSRGNTLMISAAAIFPLAALIGSALDMSRAYTAQAKLQNACDAAALAARHHMDGTSFDAADRQEGERFFDFNFPSTTMNAQNTTRTVNQSTIVPSTVVVTASADIPTAVMQLFGRETIPIGITCSADHEVLNHDVMLVLDVTSSMSRPPVGALTANRKIDMLRTGASGIYRALAGHPTTRTRFGIIPYAQSINVARHLRVRDILRTNFYLRCITGNPDDCMQSELILLPVHINDSQWARGNRTTRNIQRFSRSGIGCVEERPSIGNSAHPVRISSEVTQDDIDLTARHIFDTTRQWGRYDPVAEHIDGVTYCPSEATRLFEYSSESAFDRAIEDATASVSGNTYHDLGMVWAARFLSSTGMFASDNAETWNGIPVAKHIVFLTDGIMCPFDGTYSSYGLHRLDPRIYGSAGRMSGCGNPQLRGLHTERFLSACATAKEMGMIIWVIAFDVADTANIEPCASSDAHFFTSDGSDLEDVFARIGFNIGRLRLTE